MKIILTPQQMKNVDEYTINTLRIPSLRLMENAGKAVVNEIINEMDSVPRSLKKNGNKIAATRVLILCGKGNNGGDGFVVARLLAEQNFTITVVLIESKKELTGDALINFQRLQDSKIAQLRILKFEQFQKIKMKRYDVIVDAMLGTSFRGELKGKYLKAVEWCNKQNGLKIAVDIPTGLNGETGDVLSDAFQASVTVTMSNPKIGFYRKRAKEYTGTIVIADIGIPRKAVSKILSLQNNLLRNGITLVEEDDVQKTFPKRANNSHKHSVGKIFALAGSKSMMGAAYLCSQSAMRSGAGQVILGIPETEYSTIAKRTLEVMPLGLLSTSEGSTSLSALQEIEKRIGWSNVVLLGCGMSRNDETQQLIRTVIQSCPKPIVIDADGLNALIEHLDILKNRKSKEIVLTPHLGEFSRLIGISTEKIEQNMFSVASSFAKEYKVSLVLKGAPTIVADPNGKIFVNSTGNPGMSTAGSGDVLAGIIASFIGQGNSARDAAINGVYIHGKAGDMAAEKVGMYGLIASDLIKYLPTVLQEMMQK